MRGHIHSFGNGLNHLVESTWYQKHHLAYIQFGLQLVRKIVYAILVLRRLPLSCNFWIKAAIPGERLGGWASLHAAILEWLGLMISRRALRASWNNMDPPIALAVNAVMDRKHIIPCHTKHYSIQSLCSPATSSPHSENAASTSTPSSLMTVLSTSKHTALQDLNILFVLQKKTCKIKRARE
jgi:hypothetical protein